MKRLSWQIFTLIIVYIIPYCAVAQQQGVLSGRVSDAQGFSISYADVFLKGDHQYVTKTDSLGKFSIEAPEAGRYLLFIEKSGFQNAEEEVLIISGKDIFIHFTLQERTTLLEAVAVTGVKENPVSGSYTIPIEKALRMPANFFDPLRLVTILPGVSNGNDQANGISIRGYSPNGLLWRLQGLDIVNPNHLANAGTLSDRPVANGGGVSMISSQVLDKSQFYYGTLPSNYGNALSGVMDMSLRKGNASKSEYTIQTGLVGLDFAAEGPFKSGQRGSYLVNFRASTVGLLTKAGVDFGGEKINFYDLSFNLNFDHRKGGSLSVFGFGGRSTNIFTARPEAEWETEKDRYDIDFYGNTFALGLRDDRHISTRLMLKSGMAVSGQLQERTARSATVPFAHTVFEKFESNRRLVSAFMILSVKNTENISSEHGTTLTISADQHLRSLIQTTSLSYVPPSFSGSVKGAIIQPYSSWNFQLNNARLNVSARYLYFTFNGTGSFEPRTSLSFPVLKGSLTLGYGITSQVQQTQLYLNPDNKNLPLTRSAQSSIEYLRTFANGIRVRSTLYYHQLNNVPVSGTGSPYSALNMMEEFLYMQLTPVGSGRNFGGEAMVEKRFENQFYLMGSGSLYRSTYGADLNHQLNSRFNGRYTATAAGGKEFNSSRKGQVFGIHTRFMAFGGQRQMQIDEAASIIAGTTIFDQSQGYNVILPGYKRLDLRLSWRKAKANSTRTVSLDIQNLAGIQNVAGYYFDTFKQKVMTRYQLGFIPVLTWRLDF